LGQALSRKLFILFIAALIPFAALLLFMIQSQTDLLFPVDAVPSAGPLPRGAERLEVRTAEGETLHGVYLKPTHGAADERSGSPHSRSGGAARALILGFGGNAWNGQDVAEYLHEVFPEAHVIAFHYRGYRPSTGRPSARALMDDAPLVFDEAVARARPDRTVAVGFSIGSGVAASLARRRELAGLILVTPFDSLKAVAQGIYPWLPVGLFIEHEFPAASDLAGARIPVAIIAAERDEIIASERTASLRRQVPNLVFDRTIGGAGHNDIYQCSEFQDSLREALDAVARK
jgi:pimeloyl-ACP methyl ester carboxylesterase